MDGSKHIGTRMAWKSGGNGQEDRLLRRHLREETGCGMDQLVQQVLSEGADAVCYKPFDVPRLLTTLQQLTNDQ